MPKRPSCTHKIAAIVQSSWTAVPVRQTGHDSLLGLTNLGMIGVEDRRRCDQAAAVGQLHGVADEFGA